MLGCAQFRCENLGKRRSGRLRLSLPHGVFCPTLSIRLIFAYNVLRVPEPIRPQNFLRNAASARTLRPPSPPVRPRPINPPAFFPRLSPKELLVRCTFRMMVENSGAPVEASRVPRIAELE